MLDETNLKEHGQNHILEYIKVMSQSEKEQLESDINQLDLDEIDKINPEIFLLCGGTDGGDKKCILHNANMISKSKSNFPIIIAGNKEANYKCKNILKNKEKG